MLKKIIQRRAIFSLMLVCLGVILGYLYVNAFSPKGTTYKLEFNVEPNQFILLPEDREQIKEYATNIVLENTTVKSLLEGQDYTVQATITFQPSLSDVLTNNTLLRSTTRITLESNPVVVVTITFNDGSGYNVQVDIRDWKVHEPIFSEEVYPPGEIIRVTMHEMNRTRSLR